MQQLNVPTTYTTYEYMRRGLEPFLPPLYRTVRRKLVSEIKTRGENLEVLDVGGRKSPYTIGIPARVTVIDLPRESELQNTLNLGINANIIRDLENNRSNICNFVLGDMTGSDFHSDSFDLVVSVEVLEHVEEDARFVSEVARVLRPGGAFFMTTPNGDYLENRNPDHKRHYRREQLTSLLTRYFDDVRVEYGIAGGYYRKLGLKSWEIRKPIQTISSAIGNIVNSIQSSQPGIEERAIGTHHLLAVARNKRTYNTVA